MSTTTKRNYRASFILDTRNYQEPLETLIEKLKGVVEAVEGDVKKVENLGQKDFSRATDRHFLNGIYIQISFEGPASAPGSLKEKFKLDKTVDRILIETI